MSEPSPNVVLDHEAEPVAIVQPPVVEIAPHKKLGFGGWFALVWMANVLIWAVFGARLPGISSFKEVFLDVASSKPFTHGHILGTDDNGHDTLSMLVLGARASMEVAIGAVSAGIFVGGTLGLIAGYYKGGVDLFISTIFDVLLAVPALILALSLASFLRGDPANSKWPPEVVLIIALGVVSTPVLGRITRASALSWSQREFVMASRAQGAKNFRIMLREVLPNVLPALFSIALLAIGVVIVAEGGLSLLGVGIPFDAKPSWGNMIAIFGQSNLRDAPYLVFGPILCIFFTVMSLNFLGDVVRARFDIRESSV
jgi:peptide/nickel transport system permease protein